MAAISLGLEWNPQTGRSGRQVAYDLNRHIICFGPTRSGKGVCLEIPNLLRLGGRGDEPLSIISIDPKGQNAAVTARWRRKVSDVLFLNPLDLLGLGSSGFNPLAALDPASPHFFLHASAIAEALVRLAESGDPFWNISARNLVLALVMWEVKIARAEGRMPLLRHVRGTLTGDLSATAGKIVASGDFQLASLAGQFIEKNRTNDGIVATAASQTQWLLSQPMLDDLAKDGIDFARLKGPRPVTIYVMLAAHALETFSPWLRLVVACAFNALYRHEGGGGLRTLFLLSEFAQLGKLSMVSAALAQGAGYGIQLFPCTAGHQSAAGDLRQGRGPHLPRHERRNLRLYPQRSRNRRMDVEAFRRNLRAGPQRQRRSRDRRARKLAARKAARLSAGRSLQYPGISRPLLVRRAIGGAARLCPSLLGQARQCRPGRALRSRPLPHAAAARLRLVVAHCKFAHQLTLTACQLEWRRLIVSVSRCGNLEAE